jgi:hypothetical protein
VGDLRNEGQVAQREVLVEHLAKVGLSPEDIPSALKQLRKEIQSEIASSQIKDKAS